MTNKKAIVLGFEGADASGKTALTKHLCEYIQSKGMKAVRIPVMEGGTLGTVYKDIYTRQGCSAVIEATGMLASVIHTLEHVVEPARLENDYIILDRTLASFATFQLDVAGYTWMQAPFQEALKNPNNTDIRTIFLEVSVATARKRMHARGNLDLIEQRPDQFHQRIIDSYRRTFSKYHQLSPYDYVPTDLFSSLEEAKRYVETSFDWDWSVPI